jgi:integrase
VVDRITSDRAIASLKPAERPYEKTVGDVRGLIIRVFPSGAKAFEFRYVAEDGKRRRLPLGPYPGLSYADARAQAFAKRADVVAGRDPAAERADRRNAARQAGETLAELAEAYFRAAEKGLHGGRGRPKRASTLAVERNRFELHVKPALGDRRFKELRRADIKGFRRDLLAAERYSADTISAVLRTFSSIMAFGVHEEWIESNPLTGLTRPLATKSRERLFDEDSLAKLWRALATPVVLSKGKSRPIRYGDKAPKGRASADFAVSLALRFAILTLARRGEIVGAKWAEIDFKANIWTVPAERHKSRKTHIVPLARAALDVLADAKKLSTAQPDDFVFASVSDPKKPVHGDALTKAIKRTCANLKLPHGSPHDFRRAGATILTSEHLGVRRFVVSKVLGHEGLEGAAVTAVYDRNSYLPEKRAALEAWGAHVLALAKGEVGQIDEPKFGAAA